MKGKGKGKDPQPETAAIGRAIVTFGRGYNTLAAVRSLGRHGVEVYCGEDGPFAPCFYSKYCKGQFEYPPAAEDEEAFIDFMVERIEELKPHGDTPYVLMPIHTETMVLARHRERLSPHIRTVFAPQSSIDLVNDKGRLAKFAAEHDIRIPKTRQFHDVDELYRNAPDLPLPLFIKLRSAVAGVGLKKVETREDLVTTFQRYIDGYGLKPETYPILQEFTPGRDHCVTAMFDHGRCIAKMTFRHLLTYPLHKGPSALRETVLQPEAEEMSVKLLSALDWHGIAQLDFRIPEDGPPTLIEVNPRFFGGLAQCVASNVDYPWLHWKLATGQPVGDPPEVRTDVKTQAPVFAELATIQEIFEDEQVRRHLAEAGDSLGRLLRAPISSAGLKDVHQELRRLMNLKEVVPYVLGKFSVHAEAVDDVIQGEDPGPMLGALYPISLMLKHGKVDTALLVSEKDVEDQAAPPRLRWRDWLNPNWWTLIVMGLLFSGAMVIDSFAWSRDWLGGVLAWPLHMAQGAADRHGFGEAGRGVVRIILYGLLQFAHLYVIASVVCWLSARLRARRRDAKRAEIKQQRQDHAERQAAEGA